MPPKTRKARQKPAAALPAVPPAFLERMAGFMGDEYASFAATFQAPPRSGLRVNTLKVAPEDFAALAPFALESLPWPPAAFLVEDEAQPGKSAYHAAGLYYLQDPSAMVPAALLDPQPGERVLDLSAAPGGKATHLASLLGNRGLLVANEIHPQRVWDLAENLERWGARNAVILNEAPERLAEAFPGFFDRVLVDAPCSGEGMMRRSASARREWAPELVKGCAVRQSGILEQAARMLRPGGILVYATCTFAPEEDEGTIDRFLAGHPDFSLLQPPHHPGFAPGRPDWLPDRASRVDLSRTVRLWPQRFPGEGQFIALLMRSEGSEHASAAEDGLASTAPKARHLARATRGGHFKAPQAAGGSAGRTPRLAFEVPHAARDLYLDFCAQHLKHAPGESRLAVAGSYLYAVPDGLPDMGNLRAVHPGWWLGSFKKDRFEPSHALALGLGPADARLALDLEPDQPDVLAYLRGEALHSQGEDGWVLVSAGGYSLGWGKRVRGMLKSHYPRGLRRY